VPGLSIVLTNQNNCIFSDLSVFGKVVDIPLTIVNILQDILNRLNGVPFGALLKLVPPPYRQIIQLVLKIFEVVLAVIKKILDLVQKLKSAISKLSKVFTAVKVLLFTIATNYYALGTATSGMVPIESLAVDCVSSTVSCTDDNVLENQNLAFKPSLDGWDTSSSQCVNTFNTVQRVLTEIKNILTQPIIKMLEDILNAISAALQPIIDKINEWYHKIVDKLDEVYCCGTPRAIQVGLTAIGLTMDLLTCPLNGAINGLITTIQNLVQSLINKFADVINAFLAPIQNKLRNIVMPVDVQVQAGSLTGCTLAYPSVKIINGNPFQEFVDYQFPVVDVAPPSLGTFVDSIKNECNNAVNGYKDLLGEDCCKVYKPLGDGTFCDPTDSIPYSHCGQCTSGVNGFWYTKGYNACGDLCIPDSNVSIDKAWFRI
jgi:phage-related protein